MATTPEQGAESPEINNQLGLAISEDVEDEEILGLPQPRDESTGAWGQQQEGQQPQPEDESTGARGQQQEGQQMIDFSMILELLKQQAAEQQRREERQAAELKQQLVELDQKLSGKFDRQAAELAKMREEQRQAEERMSARIQAEIESVRTDTQQKLEVIENKLVEQEKSISEKIDSSSKKSENELKSMGKKLERQIMETREQQEKKHEETRNIVNATRDTQDTKLRGVEERIQEVSVSLKNTADKIDAVSSEKGRRLDEVFNKLTQVTEHQERLQRRIENTEGRPSARSENCEVSKDITYDGEGPFPMEFIRELTELKETYYTEDQTRWIGKHLIEGAAVWWRIIRTQVSNFTQFREVFIDKYWSSCVQERVRDQLEYGRYDPSRGLNMVEYMEHQLLKSRQLIPVISDQHLIRKLARHFHRDVQTAIVIRGIQSITAFESLLREYMSIREYNGGENGNFGRNKPANKAEQIKTESNGGHRPYNNNNNRDKYSKWSRGRGENEPAIKQPVNTITVEPTLTPPPVPGTSGVSKNVTKDGGR